MTTCSSSGICHQYFFFRSSSPPVVSFLNIPIYIIIKSNQCNVLTVAFTDGKGNSKGDVMKIEFGKTSDNRSTSEILLYCPTFPTCRSFLCFSSGSGKSNNLKS